MAAVQAEHVRVSFLFVGDLNGHHQECLGSTTTNCHGIAAFGFPTVSGSDQLVVGPTHACIETLDIQDALMTMFLTYAIKYYSSVSGGLRETKAAI